MFESHLFKQIMMNTLKVPQMNNSTMQIKKKNSCVGFFLYEPNKSSKMGF